MPWRAPPGFTSMSFRGLDIVADAHGDVDLSAVDPSLVVAFADALASHGFIPVAAPVAPAAPTRARTPTPAPVAPPLVVAPANDDDAQPQDEPGFNAAEATADDISLMNRNELFAYLKAHGVSVSPPITNDALRAIAREAAGIPAHGA